MNKFLSIILIFSTLFLLGCTKSDVKDFSNNLDNYNKCSQNVYSVGKCAQKVYGYEFDEVKNSCVETIMIGCSTQTPFESIIQCQSSCYSDYKNNKE